MFDARIITHRRKYKHIFIFNGSMERQQIEHWNERIYLDIFAFAIVHVARTSSKFLHI